MRLASRKAPPSESRNRDLYDAKLWYAVGMLAFFARSRPKAVFRLEITRMIVPGRVDAEAASMRACRFVPLLDIRTVMRALMVN